MLTSKQQTRLDACSFSNGTRLRLIQIFGAINEQLFIHTPVVFGSGKHGQLQWWPGYTIIVNEAGLIRCYGGERLEPYVVVDPGDDDLWPIIDWLVEIVREYAIIDDTDYISSDDEMDDSDEDSV